MRKCSALTLIFILAALPTKVDSLPSMKTFHSEQYGFSIQYPDDMVIAANPDNLSQCRNADRGMKPVVRFEMKGPDEAKGDVPLGALEICVGTTQNAVDSCLTIFNPNNSGDLVSHVGLVSVPRSDEGDPLKFLTSNFAAPAAGSRLSVTSYRALIGDIEMRPIDSTKSLHLAKNACYEINVIQEGAFFEEGPDVTPKRSEADAKKYGLPFPPYQVFTKLSPLVKTFRLLPLHAAMPPS